MEQLEAVHATGADAVDSAVVAQALALLDQGLAHEARALLAGQAARLGLQIDHGLDDHVQVPGCRGLRLGSRGAVASAGRHFTS